MDNLYIILYKVNWIIIALGELFDTLFGEIQLHTSRF